MDSEESNADYLNDIEWLKCPKEQLRLKQLFLDGVGALGELRYDDSIIDVHGKWSPETQEFIWTVEDVNAPTGQRFVSYHVTRLNEDQYYVVFGTTRVLGQIFPQYH